MQYWNLTEKAIKLALLGLAVGREAEDMMYNIKEISGGFFIDDATRQKLAPMEVEVATEPSWTYEMDKKLGLADPHAPPERRFTTTVRFKAMNPDLQAIENKWKEIAALLPEKRPT